MGPGRHPKRLNEAYLNEAYEVHLSSTEQEVSMRTKAKGKKRTWSKPIVQDEQAGMEVTSYASATLGTS